MIRIIGMPFFLCLAVSLSAVGAPVQIHIGGITRAQGKLVLNLFNSRQSWAAEEPVLVEEKKLELSGATEFHLDLMPGEYSFFLYHDVNGDGELQKTFLGFPAEPYAFSNGFKLKMAKPSFQEIKFDVGATGVEHRVRLIHRN